jgi:E3 ubiquitin-protein ligase NEDD4
MEDDAVDPNEFSLYSFDEFPDDKVNNTEKLEALFGKMKCYNSAIPRVGVQRGVHGALPAGWEKKISPDGREYFVDHATKTSHWSRPNFEEQTTSLSQQQVSNMQHVAPNYIPPAHMNVNFNITIEDGGNETITMQAQNLSRQLPPGWEQLHTDGGRVYYVDHTTKRTQWERPSSGQNY